MSGDITQADIDALKDALDDADEWRDERAHGDQKATVAAEMDRLRAIVDRLWAAHLNGRCCERDTDGDGNCDRHESPGVRRRLRDHEMKP